MQINQFNIRVYGIYFNRNDELLVSDEIYQGYKLTKFPGGGMEFGEGAVDCLIREIMEECGQSIKHIKHFYTTDYYEKALFYKNQQIVSIYYFFDFVGKINFKISKNPFDIAPGKTQSFRFVPRKELTSGLFTLPIDKKVALMLIS